MADDSDVAELRIALHPQRVLAASRFPARTWAYTFAASCASRTVVQRVMQWAAAPRPAGLCLYGRSRVGKTALAVCAAKQLIAQGVRSPVPAVPGTALTAWDLMASDIRGDSDAEWAAANDAAYREYVFAPVLFATWADCDSLLRRALAQRRFDDVLQALEDDVAVLVLDDIDVGSATPWREQVLYVLLERPARQRIVIVTLNRTPSAAACESVLTERLVTRLTDPGLFVTCGVE